MRGTATYSTRIEGDLCVIVRTEPDGSKHHIKIPVVECTALVRAIAVVQNVGAGRPTLARRVNSVAIGKDAEISNLTIFRFNDSDQPYAIERGLARKFGRDLLRFS